MISAPRVGQDAAQRLYQTSKRKEETDTEYMSERQFQWLARNAMVSPSSRWTPIDTPSACLAKMYNPSPFRAVGSGERQGTNGRTKRTSTRLSLARRWPHKKGLAQGCAILGKTTKWTEIPRRALGLYDLLTKTSRQQEH